MFRFSFLIKTLILIHTIVLRHTLQFASCMGKLSKLSLGSTSTDSTNKDYKILEEKMHL